MTCDGDFFLKLLQYPSYQAQAFMEIAKIEARQDLNQAKLTAQNIQDLCY